MGRGGVTGTGSEPSSAGGLGPVLDALADDTRRGIVRQLADGATPTASELAKTLPITRQAVAKHLAVLADAQLVERERRGRETRYRLRIDALDLAAHWIADVGARWERRLADLKDQVEAERRSPNRGGRSDPAAPA